MMSLRLLSTYILAILAGVLCVQTTAVAESLRCDSVPVADWRKCRLLGQELAEQEKWEKAFAVLDAIYKTRNQADVNVGMLRALVACRVPGQEEEGWRWLKRFQEKPEFNELPTTKQRLLLDEGYQCKPREERSSRPVLLQIGGTLRVHTSSKHFYTRAIKDGPAIAWNDVESSDAEQATLHENLPMPLEREHVDESVQVWKQRLGTEGSGFEVFGGNGITYVVPLSDPSAKQRNKSDLVKAVHAFVRYLNATYGISPPPKIITLLLGRSGQLDFLRQVVTHKGESLRVTLVGLSIQETLSSVAFLQRPYFGTVLHEVTHLLVGEDFPGAPYWLEEGLAMLYEQANRQGDRFVGISNWRTKKEFSVGFRSLQELMRASASTLPMLPQACQANNEWSGREALLGKLADIRAFALWLQQVGALSSVYKEMRSTTQKQGYPLHATQALEIATKVTGRTVKQIEDALNLSRSACPPS
jgi:hypothetical protein